MLSSTLTPQDALLWGDLSLRRPCDQDTPLTQTVRNRKRATKDPVSITNIW
jgi:hypothetical protein